MTAATVVKAKIISAKYSAGPNFKASSTTIGASSVTSMVAMVPATNEPMALVPPTISAIGRAMREKLMAAPPTATARPPRAVPASRTSIVVMPGTLCGGCDNFADLSCDRHGCGSTAAGSGAARRSPHVHLFFRRASQNVVSPGANPEAPARLLLVAHYDAARTGLLGITHYLTQGYYALSLALDEPFVPMWGGPRCPVLVVHSAPVCRLPV